MNITLAQEKQIIQHLRDNMNELFLASGSSRATFTMDNKIASILGFDNKFGLACVIKMSLGLGGFRQSMTEYQIYEVMPDSDLYLANILARGSILTVMEKVDTDYDFMDIYEYGDIDDYLEEQRSHGVEYTDKQEQLFYKAAETLDALDSFIGETADNAQLGQTFDGRIVSYDYGFDTALPSFEQMTSTADYFSFDETASQTFFKVLLEKIETAIQNNYPELIAEDFEDIESIFKTMDTNSDEDEF